MLNPKCRDHGSAHPDFLCPRNDAVRPISEEDQADYRQQEGEERWRARLERLAMMRGPDAPDPCEECDGKGQVQIKTEDDDYDSDGCPRCLGTGVQP